MPPSKVRTAPDDSRSEASSTREKLGTLTSATTNSKNRRAASGLGMTISGRDSAAVNSITAIAGITNASVPGQDGNAGIQWSSLDSSILNSYRHAYRINTPSAFSKSYNQVILGRPQGIGRLSPTMARQKDKRRQNKEQLATAVRKHFNGLGVQENEVVVEFLYKVRNQDKNFRLRFHPKR